MSWASYTLLLGLPFSIFYGLYAVKIFVHNKRNSPETTVMGMFKDYHWSWVFDIVWFNLLGSLTGWVLVASIVRNIEIAVEKESLISFSFVDALVLLVAFIGVTGRLPYTIKSILDNIALIVKKVLRYETPSSENSHQK